MKHLSFTLLALVLASCATTRWYYSDQDWDECELETAPAWGPLEQGAMAQNEYYYPGTYKNRYVMKCLRARRDAGNLKQPMRCEGPECPKAKRKTAGAQ